MVKNYNHKTGQKKDCSSQVTFPFPNELQTMATIIAVRVLLTLVLYLRLKLLTIIIARI